MILKNMPTSMDNWIVTTTTYPGLAVQILAWGGTKSRGISKESKMSMKLGKNS